MYSTDISKKVRSALRIKKQNGEFLSNYAPYGYKKDPLNKNRLIVDVESSEVVKRIFEMCKLGKGSKIIARTLNHAKVLTPLQYKQKFFGAFKSKDSKGLWHAVSVIDILRNRVYLGDTVQGIYDCVRFKRTPNKRKPKEAWIITPNTHEPIIDAETWELAQLRIDSRKRVFENKHVQVYAGLLRCEDCGYALSYANVRGIENYTCGQYRRHGTDICSSHYIRKELLDQVVLDDIRKYAMLAKNKSMELANQLQALNSEQTLNQLKSLNAELKEQSKRYSEFDEIIRRVYEDNLSGKINDERFTKLLAGYETEQTAAKLVIEELKQTIAKIEGDKKDTAAWIELIKNYSEIKELDKVVLDELVEKITIGEARFVNGEREVDITIYYRFVGAVG